MQRVKRKPSIAEFLPSKFCDRMDEHVILVIFAKTVSISLNELIGVKKIFKDILSSKEEATASGEYPTITFVRLDSEKPVYCCRQKPGKPYTIYYGRGIDGPLVLAFLDVTAENTGDVVKDHHCFTKHEQFFEDLEFMILLALRTGKKYAMTYDGIMDLTPE